MLWNAALEKCQAFVFFSDGRTKPERKRVDEDVDGASPGNFLRRAFAMFCDANENE